MKNRKPRYRRVVVLVNDDEYDYLKQNATLRNLDISKLVRRITFGTLKKMEKKA